MDVDVLRDWVIVVYGIVGAVAVCVVIALVLVMYRKVARILDSLGDTAETIRNTSNTISENVIQPIGKMQGFMAGILKGLEVMTSLSKKRGGEEDGE